MVPSDYVIYDNPMFYDSMVDPIDLGTDAIAEVMNQADQDWKAKAPEVEPIDEIASVVKQAQHQSIAKGRSTEPSTGPCSHYRSTYPDDNRMELLHLISLVEDRHIDLTQREDDWFKLGCVCLSVLGPVEGREAYHRLSRFYPRYNKKETDRKFSHLCRKGYDRYGLGTMVQMMCKKMQQQNLS